MRNVNQTLIKKLLSNLRRYFLKDVTKMQEHRNMEVIIRLKFFCIVRKEVSKTMSNVQTWERNLQFNHCVYTLVWDRTHLE